MQAITFSQWPHYLISLHKQKKLFLNKRKAAYATEVHSYF